MKKSNIIFYRPISGNLFSNIPKKIEIKHKNPNNSFETSLKCGHNNCRNLSYLLEMNKINEKYPLKERFITQEKEYNKEVNSKLLKMALLINKIPKPHFKSKTKSDNNFIQNKNSIKLSVPKVHSNILLDIDKPSSLNNSSKVTCQNNNDIHNNNSLEHYLKNMLHTLDSEINNIFLSIKDIFQTSFVFGNHNSLYLNKKKN